MSKFKPMELIDKMSGKFHSNSKFYAAERYGTQYTGKKLSDCLPLLIMGNMLPVEQK